MDIELKYGKGIISIQTPQSADVTVLEPKKIKPLASIRQALTRSLELLEKNKQNLLPEGDHIKTVAIAIPDETRPLPVKKILPILLDWLFTKIPDLDTGNVVIIIGAGLHPPIDQDSINRLIPQNMARGCKVISHDAHNSPMTDYGFTNRGTPILVNTAFASADYKIVVGQIDPHQFVGFTGGSKGAIIGCGSAATIEHNHSMLTEDGAWVGRLNGNPVREDLNEAGEIVGIDLAVNCVMLPSKEVAQILAGSPKTVLTEGAKTCEELYGIKIDEEFDIIVASCGGYPKDICLYQAQKGLNLASHALKDEGHILLLAESTQGVGDDVYFDYVSRFKSPEEAMADFLKHPFRMGAHKAFLFSRTLCRFDVAVTSELDPDVMKKCHLRAGEPTSTINEWFNSYDRVVKIGIVPNANTSYFIESQQNR